MTHDSGITTFVETWHMVHGHPTNAMAIQLVVTGMITKSRYHDIAGCLFMCLCTYPKTDMYILCTRMTVPPTTLGGSHKNDVCPKIAVQTGNISRFQTTQNPKPTV